MRVYLRTFGCRANQYDSERVRAILAAGGCDEASAPDDADVAIFNSCAVTADAEADLRQAVRRAARARPGLRTIVMGCASALPDDGASPRSLRALPTVERLVAGADFAAIADALALPASAAGAVASAQRGARGLLRVQDGCDEHCTFCATTIARGAHRSRPLDELVAEAERLAEHHAEIVLTGVHIGSWGKERGASLGTLVEALVARVPAARFRLSSLEATEVDARLAELLRGEPARLAPYLHAPLQSGADRVLRRMGRHWYRAGDYAAAIERLTSGLSVFGLGADVIAGFPGETEADHRLTTALVERLPFTALHVFPYSPRPGTAAGRLGEPVPPEVARARAAELRGIAARKAGEYRARRAGGAADVVIVGDAVGGGDHGRGAREGVTEDYLTVRIGDPALPRGTRFAASLRLEGGELVAAPIHR